MKLIGFMIPMMLMGALTTMNASANQKYTLNDLGILDHAGSSASAVNNSGEVLGTLGLPENAELSPLANHTFLWSKNKANDLSPFVAVAINSNGQLVGFKSPKTFNPFDPLGAAQMMLKVSPVLYSDGKWTTILPKSAASGVPTAMNDNGIVAGQIHFASPPNKKLFPAVWNSSDVHLLEVPAPYVSGVVNAINNDGQAAGFLQILHEQTVPALRSYAVRWDKNDATLLGTLAGSDQSEAIAINNKGHILCTAYYGKSKLDEAFSEALSSKGKSGKQPPLVSFTQAGFLWIDGQRIALTGPQDHVPGIDVSKGYTVRAINDDDIVVGRAMSPSGQSIAFLWQDHKMVDLNTFIDADSGWMLTDAKGINDKGQIAGQGTYNRRSHAFLLTPP